MSTPAYPFFPPPFTTENLHDDDAEVIDSLVATTSAPADITGAIEPTTQIPKYVPKAVTRLYGNTIQFSQTQQAATPYTAIPVIAEDLNRGTCYVRVYSSAATPAFADYALVADDLGKISGGAIGLCIPVHHNGVADLSGHTGRLWIIPGPALTSASTLEVCVYGIATVDNTELNNV